jgi:hypothetical protein
MRKKYGWRTFFAEDNGTLREAEVGYVRTWVIYFVPWHEIFYSVMKFYTQVCCKHTFAYGTKVRKGLRFF